MNTKVFEKLFQNSVNNQCQTFAHEAEVADPSKQLSHLLKAGITLAEATFKLSTYLSERQALVEEVLEASVTFLVLSR